MCVYGSLYILSIFQLQEIIIFCGLSYIILDITDQESIVIFLMGMSVW